MLGAKQYISSTLNLLLRKAMFLFISRCLKVNCTVSVFHTFSSVFLRFCFSLTKYALFHPHFYKSISALSRLLYIDKNFVQKFCVWTIRAIFRNRAVYPFTKIFFRKTFVQYVTVWLVRTWTHKHEDEKAHTLSRRNKNVKKRTKNGYCVKSPLNLLTI